MVKTESPSEWLIGSIFQVFETEDEVQNPNILNRHKATTEDLPEIFNGDCIPMITELVNDGNVQFLDQVRLYV